MPDFTVIIEGEAASVETAEELAVLLEVLHGDHYQDVLDQLGPNLTEILREPRGLCAVLKALSPASQMYLLNQLDSGLIDVIQRADVLRYILAGLTEPEVEKRVLELLDSDGLKRLIRQPEDLAGILEWVYDRCDEFVISVLDAHFLRQLLQTGHKISLVLPSMSETSQSILVEKLGWPFVVSLAYDARVLGLLLRTMTPELGLRLIGAFTPEMLRAAVGGEQRLGELYAFLNEAETDAVNALLGNGHAK